MISRQKDGHMVIQKVGSGKIVVQICTGGPPTEFYIPEDATNVVSINLYPQQIIYATMKLAAISDFIHTIDPPSDRLYIRTHLSEPPILSYRIENSDGENCTACYVDLRVPLCSHVV